MGGLVFSSTTTASQQHDEQRPPHLSQQFQPQSSPNPSLLTITSPQTTTTTSTPTPLLSSTTTLKSPLDQAQLASVYSQPVALNGYYYSTYDQYLRHQGFKPGHSMDSFATNAILATFAAVTIAFQVGSRHVDWAPKIDNFYMNNMTLCANNRAKPWTYLTNAFTHFTPLHLLANSMAFQSFSTSVGVSTGPAFAALFCGLAISSSIFGLALSLGISRTLLRTGVNRSALLNPAVGASGAIAAMVAIAALTDPTRSVSIFGISPSFGILPGLGAFIALDTIGLIAQCFGKNSGFSHAGHIGGYLSGIGLFMLTKQKFEKQYQRNTYARYGNWIENTWMPKSAKINSQ